MQEAFGASILLGLALLLLQVQHQTLVECKMPSAASYWANKLTHPK